MQLPSLRTLLAFEAAARHGSYTRAAEEIGLTHGAVSHSIRELEERLGVPLFRRHGRGMLPTAEAVALVAQVRQALSILDRAFERPRGRGRARLVLSLHPALGTRWLMARLGGFIAAHPKVDVEVRSVADLDDFLDRGVDLALRYGPGDWPGASSERLWDEVLFPVCAPEYRARLGLQQPADLKRAMLLRHAWQAWSAWLRAAGVRAAEPAHGVTYSDSALLLQAAREGQGVALARRLLALDDLQSGRLVRLFDVEVQDGYGYFAVWRAGMPLSREADELRAWLRPPPGAGEPAVRRAGTISS
ncbi:MAG: transcriptional regulator GcvA [Steroidobacteraceae bacterium]|jgi:LysR family glycine cleavage system transcriptional activator|nr:transcriptional regulator GcvA [Steroidobacteraceae bacterium]